MKRLVELDSMRGIAVLMVMGFHYSIPGFSLGLLGVDVFFVLSGYLITSLLIKEWGETSQINLGRFYFRRVLRLFPALFVLLLILFLFRLEPTQNILATLLYVANWATALNWSPTLEKGYLLHAWSLAIEEQFYIFWPAIIALLVASRVPKKILFLVPFSLAIGSTLVRTLMYQSGAGIQRIYRGTDTHSDGLFIGCTLAMILAFNGKPSKRSILLVSLVVFPYTIAVIFGLLPSDTIYLGGYSLFGLAVMVIIYCIAVFPKTVLRKVLSIRPLSYIGKISYGIYLWQVPVYFLLLRVLKLNNPELRLTSILLTLIIASMSYYFIESPFLRLKDRMTDARSLPLTADQLN